MFLIVIRQSILMPLQIEACRIFCLIFSGAGENTLRRLALFVYLDHPTKNDVTSGKKVS